MDNGIFSPAGWGGLTMINSLAMLVVRFGFNVLFMTMSFLALVSSVIVWRQPRRVL